MCHSQFCQNFMMFSPFNECQIFDFMETVDIQVWKSQAGFSKDILFHFLQNELPCHTGWSPDWNCFVNVSLGTIDATPDFLVTGSRWLFKECLALWTGTKRVWGTLQKCHLSSCEFVVRWWWLQVVVDRRWWMPLPMKNKNPPVLPLPSEIFRNYNSDVRCFFEFCTSFPGLGAFDPHQILHTPSKLSILHTHYFIKGFSKLIKKIVSR